MPCAAIDAVLLRIDRYEPSADREASQVGVIWSVVRELPPILFWVFGLSIHAGAGVPQYRAIIPCSTADMRGMPSSSDTRTLRYSCSWVLPPDSAAVTFRA